MAEEPSTSWRVVVAAEERKGTWMRMACLVLPRFLPGGRTRDSAPDGGVFGRS